MDAEERKKRALAFDTLKERVNVMRCVIGNQKKNKLALWEHTVEYAAWAIRMEMLTNAEIHDMATMIQARNDLMRKEYPNDPFLNQYREALEKGAAALLRRVTPNE